MAGDNDAAENIWSVKTERFDVPAGRVRPCNKGNTTLERAGSGTDNIVAEMVFGVDVVGDFRLGKEGQIEI